MAKDIYALAREADEKHKFQAGDLVWLMTSRGKPCGLMGKLECRTSSTPSSKMYHSWEFGPGIDVPGGSRIFRAMADELRPVRVGDKVCLKKYPDVHCIISKLTSTHTTRPAVTFIDGQRWDYIENLRLFESAPAQTEDPDFEVKDAPEAPDYCCFSCAKQNTQACKDTRSSYGPCECKSLQEARGRRPGGLCFSYGCRNALKDCWQPRNKKPAQPDKFESHRPQASGGEQARRQRAKARRAEITVGDTVRCVKPDGDGHLMVAGIYNVVAEYPSGAIKVASRWGAGLPCNYDKSRFVKIEDTNTQQDAGARVLRTNRPPTKFFALCKECGRPAIQGTAYCASCWPEDKEAEEAPEPEDEELRATCVCGQEISKPVSYAELGAMRCADCTREAILKYRCVRVAGVPLPTKDAPRGLKVNRRVTREREVTFKFPTDTDNPGVGTFGTGRNL